MEDIGQLYSELTGLMEKVHQAYSTWKTENKPDTAPLDTLIHKHEEFVSTHTKQAPANEIALEELAISTGMYLEQTRPLVEELQSVGTYIRKQKTYPGTRYREILLAREHVDEWIGKVLENPSISVQNTSLVPTTSGSMGVSPITNSLFIALLISLVNKKIINVSKDIIDLTIQIFNNQASNQTIELTDAQIATLLDTWQKVILAFSTDPIGTTGAHSRHDGAIEAILSFGAVHSDLEILYNQLTTNVKHVTEDSLDSLLFSLY
ncbi:MAG TPA: hypothetical protein VFN23_00165 [Ktedonobacteraceae bacterium]|nr:hypothetical protein [Ktedonobacteraceae bacterium]